MYACYHAFFFIHIIIISYHRDLVIRVLLVYARKYSFSRYLELIHSGRNCGKETEVIVWSFGIDLKVLLLHVLAAIVLAPVGVGLDLEGRKSIINLVVVVIIILLVLFV